MRRTPNMLRKRSLRCSPRNLATDIPGVSRISGSNPERLLTAGTAAEPMLGRGGILLCPRGFPAVTVRLKLRDGAAKSPCTCGLDSEIYTNLPTDDGYFLTKFQGSCLFAGSTLAMFSISDFQKMSRAPAIAFTRSRGDGRWALPSSASEGSGSERRLCTRP